MTKENNWIFILVIIIAIVTSISYISLKSTQSVAGVCENTNGNDLYTVGTVCKDGVCHTSNCESPNEIWKWTCVNNIPTNTLLSCPVNSVCDGDNLGYCRTTGPIPTTCTDTDGGDVPNIKGTTTDSSGQDSDYCIDNSQVMELFCWNGAITAENRICPYGCLNGACTQSNATLTCTDSDGDNILTQGIVTYSIFTYKDSCKTPHTIYEWTCSNNLPIQTLKSCGSSFCQNGVTADYCESVPTPTPTPTPTPSPSPTPTPTPTTTTPTCNTSSDVNCNGIIEDNEILESFIKYQNNLLSRSELSQIIMIWSNQ